MSITDELRMYVGDWRLTPSLMDDLDRGDVDGILADFLCIADRIDEQHREAMGAIKAANERMDLLEAENEKLQDENERLRSCLSDSAENSKQIMHEAHVQEEENAKLREQIETLVMYVEADGTRYWVDDDGNQHFDHSAVNIVPTAEGR